MEELRELKELKSQEIMENLLPSLAALFRMKLRSEEVVLLHSGTEGVDIFSNGYGIRAYGYIEAVNEVDEGRPSPPPNLPPRREAFFTPIAPLLLGGGVGRGGCNCVPAHMRYLVFVTCRNEALHFCVKYAKAIHVSLFGMSAHQLLPDANSQNGLCEGNNDFVKAVFTKIAHCVACFALTGEEDLVRLAKLCWRIGQQRFYAHSFQSVYDGKNITCIIFYDGNLHDYPVWCLCFFARQRYVFYTT